MTTGRLRILIVGGYGVFGGRLAFVLRDEPALTLIIAGRSMVKAQAFCAALGGSAATEPAVFDRDGDLARLLGDLQPNLVVDATGPFQTYGPEPHRLVEAAIAAGIDYLDLSDGSDFVCGISRFDGEAKRRGVYVLSGVSSFPVLTAAVVRDLAAGLARVDEIVAGVAPSPYAGVGLNVIRAIAGYAGQPIELMRDGKPAFGYALTETMRLTICPPGELPLHNTRFSLVDVPDLQLLPARWPGLRSIWIGAGPTPEIFHRFLNLLAWAVRLRLLPSLAWLAPLFHSVTNRVRWGEHRGGMLVRVEGETADCERVSRTWHLLAEGDDGPLIPSMAIAAIVGRVQAGRVPPAGARSAIGDLDLADFEQLFRSRTIKTGVRETSPSIAALALYERVLGSAFQRLPEPIRRMHQPDLGMEAVGRACVERGANPLARLVAWAFRFPAATADINVRVHFSVEAGAELWQRTFGRHSFSSLQSEGRGRFEGLVVERFGPFDFGLAPVVRDDKLLLVVRRWTLLGVPLPLAMAPHGASYEHVVDGVFGFNVEIALPLVGLIVRYRGFLKRVETKAATAD